MTLPPISFCIRTRVRSEYDDTHTHTCGAIHTNNTRKQRGTFQTWGFLFRFCSFFRGGAALTHPNSIVHSPQVALSRGPFFALLDRPTPRSHPAPLPRARLSLSPPLNHKLGPYTRSDERGLHPRRPNACDGVMGQYRAFLGRGERPGDGDPRGVTLPPSHFVGEHEYAQNTMTHTHTRTWCRTSKEHTQATGDFDNGGV